jgi:hypothetical protein
MSKELQGVDLGKCPFCGKGIAASYDDRGAVMHELPTCERFDDLEPVEFLRAVRERKAG